ncbi:MAG: hypothetical protein AAF914_03095 [Pseudomonadota bacterium]
MSFTPGSPNGSPLRAMRAEIDAALLAAHEAGDPRVIGRCYADAAAVTNDPGEIAFFLTHAYIFALEAGAPEAAGLRARLIALGADR